MLNIDLRPPASLPALQAEAERIGFTISSDPLTGALLRTLAAAKPGGQLLGLGTGVGFGSAWLLAGMDQQARLLTVDNNEQHQSIARAHLGSDPRLSFQLIDGHAAITAFLEAGRRFDLIFADMYPGKYQRLTDTLQLLAPGGLYVVDDLLPSPDWEPERGQRVETLIQTLEQEPMLSLIPLDWSVGVIIAARRG